MSEYELSRRLWRLLQDHKEQSALRAALLSLLREIETPTFEFGQEKPKEKPVRKDEPPGS